MIPAWHNSLVEILSRQSGPRVGCMTINNHVVLEETLSLLNSLKSPARIVEADGDLTLSASTQLSM